MAANGAPERLVAERPCEPVGVYEISVRLGVQQNTVAMWRYRKLLPEPSWTVSKLPAWDWPDIVSWAGATGRMKSKDGGAGHPG